MKILIIGISGFIGQFLAQKLTQKGHKVVGLDIKKPSGFKQSDVEFFIGDMLSAKDMLNATKNVDLIIALAAKHHDFGVSREEFFKVNETGTQILLDVVYEAGIQKLVFFSTVAVYGSQRKPTTEETTPEPDSNYGQSKLAAEKLINQWVKGDNNRSAVIIRPTVVFGPNNYANVYNLIDKIYRKKFIFVGRGDNIKSVAYVENLVDATIFSLTKLKPGIEVYNYADEPQMTIKQIVEIIAERMPYDLPRMRIPLGIAISLGSVFDLLAKLSRRNLPITAARMRKFATSTHHEAGKIRESGFDQKVSIEEGFKRMIDWYLQEKKQY